jgi:predicted nucleic acid-binding protein
MIVVADSSPLVALINLSQIEILPRVFGAVLVPPAVISGLGSPRRPAAVQTFAALPPGWLEIRAPSEQGRGWLDELRDCREVGTPP